MKYIRTKDGCITEGNFEIGKTIATLYGDEQITKENTADTIEELCDEFVIDNPLNWRPFPFTTPDVDKVKLLLKNHPVSLIKYNIKIYGAIWTDKGLIYVAKLNEKGEWELL